MTIELKTNTAVRIPVGPLVDPTDGKTIEGALTVTDMTVEIEHADGTGGGAVTRIAFTPAASGSDNDMALVTSSAHAIYDLELTAGNVNWLGSGKISFYDVDGFLVYWDALHVVSANYFNNKYGTTVSPVNITQIGGVVQSLTDFKDFVDTGYDPSTHVAQSDLTYIHGTALTETAGQLAASFKKFFDVATPTGTIDSIPDAVAGAAGGIAIVGSEMTVPDTQKVDLNTIKTQTVTAGAAVTVNPSVGAATIVPTNTQFEARSLLAAAYTVVGDLSNLDTTISSRGTADPGDAMTLSDDAITAAKIADNAITSDQVDGIALTGADSDTLETLSVQIAGIGAAAGAALPKEATSDNLTVAIKTIDKVGTQTSGTYASTEANDGVYHVITHAGDDIDWIYGFAIGGNRTAASLTFHGYLTGSNDDMFIQAYDFVGSDWETIAALPGQWAGTVNITLTPALLSKHTGTSTDLGNVYIRFQADGAMSSPVLNVDQLIVNAVNIGQSVGYSNGNVWVDTVDGVDASEAYVNGTADNPVGSWANALLIAAAVGLSRFSIVNGSAITTTADCVNYTFHGLEWDLALEGYDFSCAHIEEASVTGVGTAATCEIHFKDCHIGAVTLGEAHLNHCGLESTLTIGAATNYLLERNFADGIAGAVPVIDFDDKEATVALRDWQGGIRIQNMTHANSKLSIQGAGNVIIDASCTEGSIGIAGNMLLTDNGSNTVTDNARIDTEQINAQADLALSDYDPPTKDEMDARTIASADYVVVGDTIAGVTTVTNLTNAPINGDLTATMKTSINTEVDTALSDIKLDHLIAVADADDPVNDSIIAKMAASDGDWSGFDKTSDSLEAIRDRGDSSWITGGGGGITDILNIQPLIPYSIDLANTATFRVALGLTNMVDDLPSTAEIIPGTVSIDRKAIGGMSWSNILNDTACSEAAGLIYYDEVFDSGTTYAEGDSIRITFKNQKITVAANDYEVTGSDGWIFHTEIRQTMRGTNSANTTVPDAAGTTPTAVEIRQEIDSNSTRLDVDISTRAPASEYDTEMGLITSARMTELDSGTTGKMANQVDEIRTDTEYIQTQVGTAGNGLTNINLPDQTMNITGNLTGNISGTVAGKTPAEAGDAMTLEADSIKAVSYDESTAFPIKSADSGATKIARTGADSDTLETLSDEIAALNNLSAAEINTEIADVLKIDTVSEMSQGAPPVSPTMEQILNYLYRKLRNKEETTGAETATYDNAGTTKLFKSTLSDDGTTFTKGESGSGV